jgi:hypothetical protein
LRHDAQRTSSRVPLLARGQISLTLNPPATLLPLIAEARARQNSGFFSTLLIADEQLVAAFVEYHPDHSLVWRENHMYFLE